jgi:predicted small secreted protein
MTIGNRSGIERFGSMGVQPQNTLFHPLMKTFLRILALVALTAASSLPCTAMRGVGRVSKDQAAAMGLEVKATPSGPDAAWIELVFKPEGKLKNYSHVELQIFDGATPLVAYAAMGEKRAANGSITVGLMVQRAYLEKVTLAVITGYPSNYSSNEVHLKEFVDLAKIK